MPYRLTASSGTPPPLSPRPLRTCPNEWPVIFQDLVAHQQERIRKANERYSFASSFLFPAEQAQARMFLQNLQQGLDRFSKLVLEQNKYIDFGSGKVENMVGAHGKSAAIIALLTSTDRAADDFDRFLTSTSTPEAVKSKCEKLPKGQCAKPCTQKHRVLGADTCTYE
jgi:hypothetical protein